MIYLWAGLNPQQLIAAKGLGGEKGIFLRADVIRAMRGDAVAAVLMTQYVFWSQSDAATKNDGWFYLTTAKINQELAISPTVQKRVRAYLQELGILEWEKRGMPAKNFYRVRLDRYVDFVAKEGYQWESNTLTSGSDSHPQEGVNDTHIVNTGVRTSSLDTIVSGSRPQRGRNVKVNVMGEKYDRFVEWIVANYPVSCVGLPATEHQARRIAKKLGDVLQSADNDAVQKAKDNIQEFIQAIKNIKIEVDAGRYDTKYVPKFDNFAGLGVAYGKEPAYHAWAKKVVLKEKPRPFVV